MPRNSALVAVAKFPGLVDAGAGAAGHRRPAEGAVGQLDVDFDGRVAAAIENLSGVDVHNFELMVAFSWNKGLGIIAVFSRTGTSLTRGGKGHRTAAA